MIKRKSDCTRFSGIVSDEDVLTETVVSAVGLQTGSYRFLSNIIAAEQERYYEQ